jgi:hypothetical protein
MSVESELEATLKLIAKYEDQIAPTKAKIAQLQERKLALTARIHQDRADDLAYILFQIDAYEQWIKFLPKDTFQHGYWSNEYENGFQLVLKHETKEYPHIVEFIERWLPLSKAKKVGILRYDCGEDGTWQCEYDDTTGKWGVVDIRAFREDRTEFDTVEAMLAFVAEHHSFDGSDFQRNARNEERW